MADTIRTEYMTNIMNGANALYQACANLKVAEATAAQTQYTPGAEDARLEVEKLTAKVRETHDHLEDAYRLRFPGLPPVRF